MLNEMGMKCLLKNFFKNHVHQIHIIQVILMINLMAFEERGEEYDLLIIVVLELCEIVLLQHKILPGNEI